MLHVACPFPAAVMPLVPIIHSLTRSFSKHLICVFVSCRFFSRVSRLLGTRHSTARPGNQHPASTTALHYLCPMRYKIFANKFSTSTPNELLLFAIRYVACLSAGVVRLRSACVDWWCTPPAQNHLLMLCSLGSSKMIFMFWPLSAAFLCIYCNRTATTNDCPLLSRIIAITCTVVRTVTWILFAFSINYKTLCNPNRSKRNFNWLPFAIWI